MADLATVFRAEVSLSESRTEPMLADDSDSIARLPDLCARGRAAFPDLSVDEETFVRHLARCAAGGGRLVAVSQLAIEDLYLTCACIRGVEGAVARFEALCAGPIRAALSGLTKTKVELDEVEQQLRTELLVATAQGPAKIQRFRGQAPLTRWVAVVARRLAISMLRSHGAETRAREQAAVEASLDRNDPVLALAKRRYGADFQRAVKDAISRVGQRERMLLRLHLVAGCSTRKIAGMYRVTQPTASRWLEQARELIADQTQRLLCERLNLSVDEVNSLALLVKSDLDLSLSRLLQAG